MKESKSKLNLFALLQFGALPLLVLGIGLFAYFTPGDSPLANFLDSSSSGDFEVKCDAAVIPKSQNALHVQGRFPRKTDYQDSYSKRIVDLLSQDGSDVDEVKFDIGALDQLAGERRTHLFRYLSAHPGWRLYQDRGGLKAVRRYKFQNVWQSNEHRADGDFGGWIGSWEHRRRFYVRIVIGFDRAWFSHTQYGSEENRIDVVKANEVKFISAIASDELHRSDIEIRGKNISVNLFEMQPFEDRRLTKAFLELMREEFAAVAEAQNWDELRILLPKDSVSNCPPSLSLYGDSLGEYVAFIRVNPGEAGRTYLKARGLKTGSELWETSIKGLERDTNEYIGWSANQDEQFFVNASLTIYDGRGSRTKSPVKMEVWFSPDAGGEDRKLLEKVFMLTSWER